MLTVDFYTREKCKLCEEAHILLEILQHKYNFHIEVNDIETNDKWFERYHIIIPVIKIGHIELNSNMIDIETIEKALSQFHYENDK